MQPDVTSFCRRYSRKIFVELAMASVALNLFALETELTLCHNQLIKELEKKYTNHINEILKQKDEILDNLQQQFIEKRNDIKDRILSCLQSRNDSKAMSDTSKSVRLQTVSEHQKVCTPVSSINTRGCPKNRVCDIMENLETSSTEKIYSKDKQSKRKDVVSLLSDSEDDDANRVKPNQKNFKCPQCIYSSNSPKCLAKHVDTEHRVFDYKPVKCSHCDKRFFDFATLRVHIRAKHKKGSAKGVAVENMYKCKKCNFTTDDRSNLQKHKELHKTVKPFVCKYDQCHKRFTKKRDLKKHIERIHDDDDKYQCSYCRQKFRSNKDLEMHSRTPCSYVVQI